MVDLSFLKKFTKGNPKKMKRYISMYLNIVPVILNNMQSDIQEKNWPRLAINAHSLKPQVDYMGIPSLKEIIISIEVKAKQISNEDAKADLEDLLEKANKLHKQSSKRLEEYLQELLE